MDDPTQRTIEALENIAAELERLRVLKEYELGVEVRGQDEVWRLLIEAGVA